MLACSDPYALKDAVKTSIHHVRDLRLMSLENGSSPVRFCYSSWLLLLYKLFPLFRVLCLYVKCINMFRQVKFHRLTKDVTEYYSNSVMKRQQVTSPWFLGLKNNKTIKFLLDVVTNEIWGTLFTLLKREKGGQQVLERSSSHSSTKLACWLSVVYVVTLQIAGEFSS